MSGSSSKLMQQKLEQSINENVYLKNRLESITIEKEEMMQETI